MNIGHLNHRCTIQYKSVSQDANYGTDVITWTVLDTRWCGLMDDLPSRSESVKGGLSVSNQRTRLRMRYCTDVDSSMRVIVNRPTATTYQIIAGPAILGDMDGVEFVIEKVSS